MKSRLLVEPHLVIHEVRVPKGREWKPHSRGWCLLHIESGISYWQEQNVTQEIPVGATLLFSGEARGEFRASQLSEVSITYFCVEIDQLLGLLSMREHHVLKQSAAQKSQAVRILPADDPISERCQNLLPSAGGGSTTGRLRLVEIFMDLFDRDSGPDLAAPAPVLDLRARFRQILNQMAASEFTELSVADLAPMMPCSRRHLNRLFRAELGASFREKQIELRLAKACQLLTTSDAKVVEVALESGYQSSSVFSELFKKHLGVSPGQWRRHRLSARVAPRLHF